MHSRRADDGIRRPRKLDSLSFSKSVRGRVRLPRELALHWSHKNGKMVGMKTTMELPDALMMEVRLRAIHNGRKLKDEMEAVIRRGLAADGKGEIAQVARDQETGLPVIRVKHPAGRGEMGPERVAEILNRQERDWVREARGR
jgi:plasmid stability protein